MVCPVIDIINDNSFAYVRSFELHWGAFNWNLHFRWFTLGGAEVRRRKLDIAEPFPLVSLVMNEVLKAFVSQDASDGGRAVFD